MNFTPGPWVFDPRNNGNENGYGNGITTIKSGWTLAHIPHRNPDWEANARLIAMAPDMYELLERCLEIFERDADIADGPNGPVPDKAMSMALDIVEVLSRVRK